MAIETGAEVREKLTPDDIERMLAAGELDSNLRFELVDGEIELAPAGLEHDDIGLTIGTLLTLFSWKHGGRAFGSSAGFKVGSSRRELRSPDASYIRPERLNSLAPDEFGDGAPDLAVEVLSCGQYGEACAKAKAADYLQAGGTLVWLVNPGI
ncbi:MAG: Uma2 family endonuclease, partial [Chloroflexota bacterium]